MGRRGEGFVRFFQAVLSSASRAGVQATQVESVRPVYPRRRGPAARFPPALRFVDHTELESRKKYEEHGSLSSNCAVGCRREEASHRLWRAAAKTPNSTGR